MPYDKNIPDVLQLLRLDLGNVDYTVPSDTTIARYTIVGAYFPRYCIADVADDADTMDIQGAIEETMHTILDYGGTPEDLRTAMGLVPEAEIDSDIIESGEYVPVDLGYCLDGQLTGFEVLPLDECDIKDALNGHQIENVMTALNNLPVKLRLPAAKLLSQKDYEPHQAFEICKAFESGIDEDVIGEHIANPDLDSRQMLWLRLNAEVMDLTSPDASPYYKETFEVLASEKPDSEKLFMAKCLMSTAKSKDIAIDPVWLCLDSEQIWQVRRGILDGVPMDTLAMYTDGSYSPYHMHVLNDRIADGMGKSGIERLMTPELSDEQVMQFALIIESGHFTEQQLDMLCDPYRPLADMQVMRTALANGVDEPTVLRFADGRFSPEQMEALYLAAGDKDITPEMLDVIADPSLSPEQMTDLKISFQQGGTVTEVQSEKKSMPRHEASKGDTSKSGSVHDAAKESRDASAQLGSENRGDKEAVEREELE